MAGIDHMGLSVSDFAAAKAFYDAALKPLGISVQMQVPKRATGGIDSVGYGVKGKPFFWLAGGGKMTPRLHIAFAAELAPRWMPSTRPRSLPAARTTVRRASRPPTPTTMVPSFWMWTATTSKLSATNPLDRLRGDFNGRPQKHERPGGASAVLAASLLSSRAKPPWLLWALCRRPLPRDA